MTAKEKVNTYRKQAIVVGILFIIATAFLFIGKAVYAPILESPDYLNEAYPNRIMATLGILLEFACVLSIPLIPIVLFPILKKQNETLALSYVVFRFFEAVLFILVEINALLLINVSELYLENGGADITYLQSIGHSIQSWNAWGFTFYVIIFTSGALMFYTVLYQSKLVPRFLSVWGFLSAALLLVGSVMALLEVPFTTGASFELIFAMPIAINEMVLAVWLIFKGFNPAALAASSGTDMREKRPLIAHA